MDPFRSWPEGPEGEQAARQLGRVLGVTGGAAISFFGGEQARRLAQQAVRSVVDAGGCALLHGLSSAAQNAWAARITHIPAAVFFLQSPEGCFLSLTDGWGLPLLRCTAIPSPKGRIQMLRGSLDAYASDAARQGRLGHSLHRAPRVAVEGQEPADQALVLALRRMGCPVSPRWKRGLPCFQTRNSGLSLVARDESGTQIRAAQLLAVSALVELENGGGQLAVPQQTGAAAELLSAGFSRPVLRLDRDGAPATQLYRTLPWLYDGVFAAVRLCARMRVGGERLEQLCRKTPQLTEAQQELVLHRPPQTLLAQLSAQEQGWTTLGRTLRRRTALGWVSLIPLHHPALRILAESEDMEAAAELCQRTLSQVQRLDEQTK